MAKYVLITEESTRTRLDQRYFHEVSTLKDLGFRHLAYCLEDHGPFSAITQLPIIPMALSYGEVLVVKRPLRLGSANVLLSAENPTAIALCMGMGTKIYSLFSDGMVVISSDFESSAVPRSGSKIVRLPPRTTLRETWTSHKFEVLNRQTQVALVQEAMTFEDYVKLSALEEDLSQYVIE